MPPDDVGDFDVGGAGGEVGGGFDVGRIEGTLGYKHDTRGLRAWDRDRERARRDASVPIKQDVDVKIAGAQARLKQLQAEINKIEREIDIGVDVDIAKAKAKLGALHGEVRKVQRALAMEDLRSSGLVQVEADAGRAGRALGGGSGLTGVMTRFNRAAQFMRNSLRLIRWPAFIAGAGGAVAVLSSLTAGAVALVSALGPLSGLLVTMPAALSAFGQTAGTVALAGIGDLTDAVESMADEQLRAGDSAVDMAESQRAAADQVRTAETALSAAKRAATVAEEALTRARADATRQLEDLRAEAEGSALSERGAAFALRDAEKALTEAIRAGASRAEIRRLSFDVEEAEFALAEARRSSARAQEDLTEAERAGVRGSEAVRSARRGVADANRAVIEANRDLADATREASESLNESSAAADETQRKLAALTPAARDFAQFLFGLKPELDSLQQAAGEEMFPGLERGITGALRNLPEFRTVIRETGAELGDLAERGGELAGRGGFGRDFLRIGRNNVDLLDDFGRAGFHAGDALRHILVAADPLLEWLGDGAIQFTRWIEVEAKAGRETGELADFFEEATEKADQLVDIGQSLGATLLGIGRAATPLGADILDSFEKGAEGLERWVESTEGRNELERYFSEAQPAIFEAGRLVSDFTEGFFELASMPGLDDLIRQLRTELLPAVGDVMGTMTREFGPALVDLLTEGAELLGHLAGGTGPMTMFVRLLAQAASAANEILDSISGLDTVIGTLISGGLILKLFGGLGRRAGSLLGLSIASSAATSLAAGGGGPAAAVATSWRGRLAAVGKRLGLLALGVGLIGGVSEVFQRRDVPGLSDLEGGMNDFFVGAGRALGINMGETTAEMFSQRFREGVEDASRGGLGAVGDFPGGFTDLQPVDRATIARQAREIERAYELGMSGEGSQRMLRKVAEGNARVVADNFRTEIRAVTAEEQFANVWDDLAPDEKRLARQITRAMNAANRIAAQHGIAVSDRTLRQDPAGAARALEQFERSNELLRSGALETVDDIERVSRRASEAISTNLGRGSEAGRRLLAENMRATAGALAREMTRSGDVTKEGMDRVQRLIREADLIQGLRTKEFGQEFADMFAKAGRVSEDGLDRLVRQFRKGDDDARQSLFDAMNERLRVLRRHGDLEASEVRRIRSRVLSEFDELTVRTGSSTFELVKGVLSNFGAMGGGIGAAIELVRDNVNKGLVAFGVEKLSFAIRKIGNLLGGDRQTGGRAFARGGFLPGQGREDTVLIAAAPDEAWLTGWQQAPVEYALARTAAMGEQPYGSLDDLFRQEQRTHRSAPRQRGGGIRAFQRGGAMAGPYQTTEDVLGSGPGFIPMMNYLNSMFGPLTVISGRRPGSIVAGTSSLSNHSWGGAVDISTPGLTDIRNEDSATQSRMDAADSWLSRYFPPPIGLDQLWRTLTGGFHYDHIHKGIERSYSFDPDRMLQYISTLPRGGQFGVALKRLVFEGDTPLHRFAQGAIDPVQRASARYLSRQQGFGIDAASKDPHGDGLWTADQMGGLWAAHRGPRSQSRVAGAVGMAESGGDPRAVGPPTPWGTAKGLWQILGQVVAGNIFDPDVNAENAVKKYTDADGWSPWEAFTNGNYLAHMQRGGRWAFQRGGALLSRIRDLYGRLRGSDSKNDRDRIEDQIAKLEGKLRRTQRRGQRSKLRKIRQRGALEHWRDRIAKRQRAVDVINDDISSIEIAHGTSEMRDVDQLLRDLGLDPNTELAALDEAQRATLEGMVNADYVRESGELGLEVKRNQDALAALLALRETLLAAIAEAERRAKAAKKAMEEAERREREAERDAKQAERDLGRLRKDLAAVKGDSKSDRERRRTLGDRIAAKQFDAAQYHEKAREWGGIFGAQRDAHGGLRAFVDDDAMPALEGVQGIGRTMERGIVVGPLGTGTPIFGGEIINVQARLADLGSTQLLKPELDYTSDAGDQDIEAMNRLLLEKLEGRLSLEALMRAQAGIFRTLDLSGLLGSFMGGYRQGTGIRGLPGDGLYVGHEDEIVISQQISRAIQAGAISGGGDGAGRPVIVLELSGELAALNPIVRQITGDELERRGQKAAVERMAATPGVYVRRVGA